MSFFRAKEIPTKSTHHRVKKLRTEELLSWADITIMSLGRAFDQYRLHDEPLEEVLLSVRILDNIFTELQERLDNAGEGR